MWPIVFVLFGCLCQFAHVSIALFHTFAVMRLAFFKFILYSIIFVLSQYKICSRHEIAEILLKLALNTNQSINQYSSFYLKLAFSGFSFFFI